MKKAVYMLLLILPVLWQCTTKKEVSQSATGEKHIILELKLKGKKYDSLILYTDYPVYKDGVVIAVPTPEFKGHSTDGYNWTFNVPDSVNRLAKDYIIRYQPFDFAKNEGHQLMFSAEKYSPDKRMLSFALGKNINTIEGKYMGQVHESYEGSGLSYSLPDTFAISPNLIYDIIDVDIKENKKQYNDFELVLRYPYFDRLPSSNYDNELQQRIDLVKEYPNSEALMRNLIYATGYRNKEDKKRVFDYFSPELKAGSSGSYLNEFLLKEAIPFKPTAFKLMDMKSETQASLFIGDKPTLIVFSASWCKPCHKRIPQLKEINNQIGNEVTVVYVSLDEKSGLGNWKKLMKEENIPWNSFWIGENNERLLNYFNVKVIPYAILARRDGSYIKVDTGNKEELYNAIMKNKY